MRSPGPAAPAPRIAPATAADAAFIARLGAQVFYKTFAHVTPPADMQAFLSETYAPARVAAELADPAHVFRVARAADDALAGFAQLRQGPPDPAVRGPAPVELQRLYVDSRWHGLGVAQALMHQAIDWAVAAGFRTLWLGVWEHNVRAQRFYRKYGLEVCGSHIF
ncbi:MAG TPA: GNAT family N-acetyltransferase, partial [Myxococcota bacterium]|nr:GNAT family N-acetyltransferase [Myxococcota bacterium]